MEEIKCLDKGYVRLEQFTPGADLSVVNAAKASFRRRSTEIGEKEIRLIQFLSEATPPHRSPFRHAMVTFEIRAPIMVARQWFKYRVGAVHTEDSADNLGLGNGDDGSDDLMYGRNEMSRRYVTESPDFYIPTEWRMAAENKKQGSAGPVDASVNRKMVEMLEAVTKMAVRCYDQALAYGVAPEQARLLLPYAGMYTSWWWTASLDGVFNFLEQRLGKDAQHEINEYARAVHTLMLEVAPHATQARIKTDAR